MTQTPTTTPAPSLPAAPDAPPDVAELQAHLDDLLSDSLRRATTRAEHIRLLRIQSAVAALYGVLAA